MQLILAFMWNHADHNRGTYGTQLSSVLLLRLRCLDAEGSKTKRESRGFRSQRTPLWQGNGTLRLDSECDSPKWRESRSCFCNHWALLCREIARCCENRTASRVLGS